MTEPVFNGVIMGMNTDPADGLEMTTTPLTASGSSNLAS